MFIDLQYPSVIPGLKASEVLIPLANSLRAMGRLSDFERRELATFLSIDPNGRKVVGNDIGRRQTADVRVSPGNS